MCEIHDYDAIDCYWDCGATRLRSRTSVEAVKCREIISLERDTFLASSSSSVLSDVPSDTVLFRLLTLDFGAKSELLKNQFVGRIFDNFFLVDEASFVFWLQEFSKIPGSFTEKFSSFVFFPLRPSLSLWLQVKCLLERRLCPKSSLSKRSAKEEFRLWLSPKVELFLLTLSLSMLMSSSERRDCEPTWPPPSKHLSISVS